MSDKVNIIMHTKTEGGFIAQHPQTNIDMVEGLDTVLKDKASQDYVDTVIGKIPAVFHDKEDDSVQEVYSPTWFDEGISICNHRLRSSFPSIDKSGISITFIGNNSNYGQIYIVNSGEMWSRRSLSKSSWGNWYSSKKEIDKKADKDYVDTAIDKKANSEDITNYGSISDDKDTGEVTTRHTRQVNVSFSSQASGISSQVNASTGSKVTKSMSQVNASDNSEASGVVSQVNASTGSKASGSMSQVNASDNSNSNASTTSIIASSNSNINDTDPRYKRNIVMMASSEFEFNPAGANDHKVVGGYKGDLSWMLDAKTGDIKASGKIEGNSTRADFAEYMESSNGKQLKTGSLVALDNGQKIRLAQEGDNPVGVISETAGLILNAQSYFWKNKYLHDRYGQVLKVTKYNVYSDKDGNKELLGVYSEGEDIPEVGDSVNGHKVSDVRPITTKQLNSNYKEDVDYIARSERPEWNVVGMKGQVYVNIDNTVKEHDFIQAGKDGVATKGNHLYKNWQVMEITTPYSAKLGHGIARVII